VNDSRDTDSAAPRALPSVAPLAPEPTPVVPAVPDAGNGEVARVAGRGGLAVAFAKLYFIGVGLVQQVILPRVLGLDGYGAWSTVQSVAGIAYNPVVSTSIQGVSRAVAQAPDQEQPGAIRKALRVHAMLAVPLAVLFFVCAEPVSDAIKAPHVATALRIMSGVMLVYALYAPLIGVANGRKRFVHQAALDVLSATLRTIGLVGGGYALATRFGTNIDGAAAGFVAASLVTLGLAVVIVGIGKSGGGGPTTKQHLVFLAPLFLGQTIFNLLLQADSLLLRRFCGEAALARQLPLDAADPLVGAYRATQLFSFLPYQLLIAITFILFPMLATAHRDGDKAAVGRYVQTGVRLALVLAGLAVSVTSGLAGPLLRLVFNAEAAELGTRAMELLTIGFGAFAILGVLTTVLNSLKKERTSAALTAIAFALVVVLAFVRVRGAPFGEELLWRMATATSAGLALATVAATYFVKRAAGAVVAALSVVRVAGAMALAIFVARHLPYSGKVMTLVHAAIVVATYVTALLVTREIGRSDARVLRQVLARRGSR
jgi:stage V sporulation protein B